MKCIKKDDEEALIVKSNTNLDSQKFSANGEVISLSMARSKVLQSFISLTLSTLVLYSYRIALYAFISYWASNQYILPMIYSEFIITFLVAPIFKGIANSFDTIGCLAYGRESYRIMANYFIKVQFLILYSMLGLIIFFWGMGIDFFIKLSHGKFTLVQESHFRIIIYIHIVCSAIFNIYGCSIKYLNIIGSYFPILIVSIIGIIGHVIISYVVTVSLQMEVYQTQLILLLSYLTLCILIQVYIYIINPQSKTLASLSTEQFFSLKVVSSFLFCIPFIFNQFIPMLSAVLMIFAALSNEDNFDFIFGFNYQIEYFISLLGSGAAFSIISTYGVNLGAGKVEDAKRYLKINLLVALSIAALTSIGYFCVASRLIFQFTSNVELIANFENVKIYEAINVFNSIMINTFIALFLAMNKQKLNLAVNFLTFMVVRLIAVSQIVYLGNYGVIGVYYSLLISDSLNVIINFVIVLLFIDVEEVCITCREFIKQENNEPIFQLLD